MEKVSLNYEPEKNYLVTQSNALIESRQVMTAGEKKLILVMASAISPKDEDFKEYVINIPDVSKILGIKNNHEYRDIMAILERLQKRLVWIPSPTKNSPNRRRRVPWISSTIDDPDRQELSICFDRELKPFLLKLKEEFSQLPISVMLQFSSFYAVRIYELLKQYQKFGKREFEIEDLRDKLGVNEYDSVAGKIKVKRKYTAYKDFRRRVLDQAKKQLDSKDSDGNYISDISFEYIAKKTGRRVTRILFFIKCNIDNKETDDRDKSKSIELYDRLLILGVGKKTASKHIEERSEEYIKEKISLYEETSKYKNVKNPAGFINSAIEEDWKSAKLKIKKKEIAENKKKKEEQVKKDLEAVRERIERKIKVELRKGFLASLSVDEENKILDSIKLDYRSENSFMLPKIEKQGIGCAFIQDKINIYLILNKMSKIL